MTIDNVTIVRYINKTVNYTAIGGDFVRCDTTGGSITITLPDATLNENRQIIIKKISNDGNIVTVNTTSSQNIDSQTSSTTAILDVKGTSFVLISNSVSWDLV